MLQGAAGGLYWAERWGTLAVSSTERLAALQRLTKRPDLWAMMA